LDTNILPTRFSQKVIEDLFRLIKTTASAKNGIAGCISFYLKSGQDDPGINRFSINIFIREEIRKGNKV
jgi:hypothetical protein